MKNFLILVAAISLVAASALGAVLTIHRSDRLSDNNHATEKPNFSAYENPQYGFSFSYPTDWKFSRLNEDDSVVNFDAANGSRMTVYALDFSGSGISPLLKTKEEKTIKISGIDSKEQVWVWDQQALKAGQIGLIAVRMNAAGGPLEIDFQPAIPEDLPLFQGVLNSLKL
jgi:hypothetical protein